MSMTPEAKAALSSTIRGLRERLLTDLRAAAETEYRLSIRARDAGLDESARTRRGRFETWLAEQVRAQDATAPKSKRSEDDFRREAEKQAAYTLLNRLVLLRLMEAPGPSGSPLRSPAVLTGGWESRAYLDFRQLAPGLVRDDETEGYAFLLRIVFEDLAIDLPGLYGPNGIADLIPVPASTLRHVVDKLNARELESCWTDEMTLGWVYQYWNDPDREALDAKLNSRGKLEPYEIASKTQMFTERYMVDWLLQNSIGPMWLAMCRKHGWTPDVEKEGTLAALEARREDWRARRGAGTVELTGLMPLYSDTERRWAYYLPQPIPENAITPDSIRDLMLLDPAVGSGHFLVVALDLLAALYREEARHRGKSNSPEWTEQAIVERILTHNLHGIDLDPRAVQIAAAALWLRARQMAPDAHPAHLNLVASNLRLASLPDDDPALVELRREVECETSIPAVVTDTVLHALRGADHLGSLLKIDHAVEEALDRYELDLGRLNPEQGGLFTGFNDEAGSGAIDRRSVRATLLDIFETFLGRHTSGADLGLRLRGEQLSAGVRFVRLLRESVYDLVVANPPYQGTGKMINSRYVAEAYRKGKTDLYAAFMLRGLELTREGGISAMLTMRNWMFTKQYEDLREHLLASYDLRALGDFGTGAFEEVSGMVVSVCASIFWRSRHHERSVAQNLTAESDEGFVTKTACKRAATLCHVGLQTFDLEALRAVPNWPLVYWWDERKISRYIQAPKIADIGPARFGVTTGNDDRFVRFWYEGQWPEECSTESVETTNCGWSPIVMGAKDRKWMEPLREIVWWASRGLEIRVKSEFQYGSESKQVRNQNCYFQLGIAFSMIGSTFRARAHRFPSVIGAKGSSLYPARVAKTLCAMNRTEAAETMAALNPGTDFQVGDVNRLPLFYPAGSDEIFLRVQREFGVHEAHRETSVEFRQPGPSPWRHVQEWAQAAVDRAEGEPLPPYVVQCDPESDASHISFALGVALGRFLTSGGRARVFPEDAEGYEALPHGLLFLDTTLGELDYSDGLGHPGAMMLRAVWDKWGSRIARGSSLRKWLAGEFFKEVHRGMYENRPIYWPLSSQQKTFVAWISIHRFDEQTLRVLLADYIAPALVRLEGELNDLRAVRDSADKEASRAAEKLAGRKLRARDELREFMTDVERCADRGPGAVDNRCPAREQDARYALNLNDGVAINSAALWPLLEPQWRDPKKWWKELSTARDGNDCDWSHSAMRYWPTRVDGKCQTDPSLAVAHRCFWRYHPARAWAWELRLQHEISPGFRICEEAYRPGGRDVGDTGESPHREAWLRDHPDQALSAVEKEAERRMGRGKKRAAISEMRILESGLWTYHAAEIWNMEIRLAEKQGRELRILAPDEPEARGRFERENPGKVIARTRLLENLVPPADWLEESNEESVEVDTDEDALAEIDGEEESQ